MPGKRNEIHDRGSTKTPRLGGHATLRFRPARAMIAEQISGTYTRPREMRTASANTAEVHAYGEIIRHSDSR